jgi:ubiquinone biosynthesis accessory factor UbiK
MNKQLLSDLSDKLCALFPDGLQGLGEDTKKNIHSVLQATFEKCDLVTREEFDAQCAVLARTREKIENLEKQLEDMSR